LELPTKGNILGTFMPRSSHSRASPDLRLVTAKKRPARPRAPVVSAREPRTASLPFLAVDTAAGNRLVANALARSILLPLVVLALRFSPVDLAKFDRGVQPLEVALVNAKSQSKPARAEILAQTNLDGGGNTDADRRAKTPLPVLPKDSASNELALAAQKVDE